ncbi:hypothetical protein V1478_005386 [Vespula squamosa]|uniref:Uncharacterized protein n=1 Tax=Vespula squamosa TaxID=30214 RepID=A0ABD2BE08_VESSQ
MHNFTYNFYMIFQQKECCCASLYLFLNLTCRIKHNMILIHSGKVGIRIFMHIIICALSCSTFKAWILGNMLKLCFCQK